MILYLLAISCGAIIWVKALPFVYYIKRFIVIYRNLPKDKPLPRIKPFDCESCLSFWGSLGYLLATSHPFTEALAIATIMYCFTALLSKLI